MLAFFEHGVFDDGFVLAVAENGADGGVVVLSLVGSMISATTLVILNYALAMATFRSKRPERLAVLETNGKISVLGYDN